MGRRSAVFAAAAGVAAVAFGAGVGELVAGFIAPGASPVATISDALIDVAPAWAKETAIAWFGTGDKIALVVGVVIVLIGVAAVAGLVEARRPPLGRVLGLLVGAVGAVVAVTRPGGGWLDAVPAALAGIGSAVALGLLVRRMPWAAASGPRTVVSGFDGRTVRIPPPADLDAAAPAEPIDANAAAAATSTLTGHESTADRVGTVRSRPTDGDAAAPSALTGRESRADRLETVRSRPMEGASAASGFWRTDRRRFLAWSGGAFGLGALGALGGAGLRSRASVEQAARDAVPIPAATEVAPGVPRAARLVVEGLPPVVTSNRDFYRIDTAIFPPVVSVQDWRLRIHGLVEEEVTISWNDLVAEPLEESYTTLMCVSNEVGGSLIGTAKWRGYPIRELLGRARPTGDADMVLSTSADGFTASTPLEALTDDRNAILAVAMDGRPLPIEHGFPVRSIVPGLYGYVSATKWVVDMEVTRMDRIDAYWTQRGWGELGPIKISSRIDVPRSGDDVSAGEVSIGGVAWAQHTGISKVEFAIDGSDWITADIADAGLPDSWVQWAGTVEVEPGDHLIWVRATDSDGLVQDQTERDVLPDGATGYHVSDFRAS